MTLGKLLVYVYLESVPFTRDVLSGASSLGGSESACLGLMEALARRGHDVHAFAMRLADDATGEWRGVQWHQAEKALLDALGSMPPDVFVSLRMASVFNQTIPAGLVIYWGQDLLIEQALVGQFSQVDHVAYVSEYHRQQWEAVQPILKPLGWVTRNGINPDDVPTDLAAIPKARHRFIYASRPERGLAPLLRLWPQIRATHPDAELLVCRYRSMYDGEGSNVAAMVAQADRDTARMAEQVGGIRMLGQLNKRQLYEAIASCRLMLYPGVKGFAETNCIAATEAQACGTPLVASWKGALPETVHPQAGVLIEGDALTPGYQAAFLDAVDRLCADDDAYDAMRRAGLTYALPRASHDTIAAEWETQIGRWFTERYEQNKIGVLRQLLHWDRHAAGLRVADEILRVEPDQAEARAAKRLCERVIAQQEHTPETYASTALTDVAAYAAHDARLRRVAEQMLALAPTKVADVACGIGGFALLMAQACPACEVDGWDYSLGVLAKGQEAVQAAGVASRVRFHQGDWSEVRGVYDALFCGEFLEHTAEPWLVVDRLEQHVKASGRLFFTVPVGPFSELLNPMQPNYRGNVQSFHIRDLTHMLADKRELAIEFLPCHGITPRGAAIGYWIFSFAPGSGPAQALNYDHTIVTTRPYQRIVASMIVKDGGDWLPMCLKSIWQVVDKILIYDTGSTDGSQDAARTLKAEVVQGDWPEDFAEARNRALALAEPHADWVLWIDADERLEQGPALRRYTTGAGPFVGYVIRQHHLMLDVPDFSDKPVRLFKAGRGVRFYGCVHEQPEQGLEDNIFPALELPEVEIVHYGYQSNRDRREKLLERNLALLTRSLSQPHPRELDFVLAIRDYVHLAGFARERERAMTPEIRQYLAQAVALYREKFMDPAHKYHSLAREWYEQALAWLNQGVEIEWAFGAGVPHLQQHVKPTRFRAFTHEEVQREIQARVQGWLNDLKPPNIHADPFLVREGGWALPTVAQKAA